MAVLRPEQLQYLTRKRLGLTAESDTAKRRVNEDYGVNQRLIDQNSREAQTNAADQLASQGLFHSGIRVTEQGNIQRDANQALGDLNLSRSRSLEDIGTSLAQGLANVDFEQSQALAERNREEQQKNMERAMLDAQRNAAMVGPIGYPNPVIGLQQQQNMAGIPSFLASNGRNPYNSYTAFRQANPQLSNMLMFFNNGDYFGAEREAIRSGYIIPVRTSPAGGRRAV